jgi:hypothetical protein
MNNLAQQIRATVDEVLSDLTHNRNLAVSD